MLPPSHAPATSDPIVAGASRAPGIRQVPLGPAAVPAWLFPGPRARIRGCTLWSGHEAGTTGRRARRGTRRGRAGVRPTSGPRQPSDRPIPREGGGGNPRQCGPPIGRSTRMTACPSWNQTCRMTWPGRPPRTSVQKVTRVPAGKCPPRPTSRRAARPVPTPCSATWSASVGGGGVSTDLLGESGMRQAGPGILDAGRGRRAKGRGHDRRPRRAGTGQEPTPGCQNSESRGSRRRRARRSGEGRGRPPGGAWVVPTPCTRWESSSHEPPLVLRRASAPLPLAGQSGAGARAGALALRARPHVALPKRPGGQGVEITSLERLQVMGRDPRGVGHGIEPQPPRFTGSLQQLAEGAVERGSPSGPLAACGRGPAVER